MLGQLLLHCNKIHKHNSILEVPNTVNAKPNEKVLT